VSRAVYKSGVVLTIAAICGFFANMSFSIFLEQDIYGKVITLFTIVSIVVLIVPLGTNSYFLLHRDIYYKYSNAITIFPMLISAGIGTLLLTFQFSILNAAFLCLLIVSSISIQGILKGQVEQDSLKAALYQSLQPFLKSLAALLLLVVFFFKDGSVKSADWLAYGLIVGCSCVLPLALAKSIDSRHGGSFYNFKFFINFNKKELRQLSSFWFSSILGNAYSLGVIPLVAYFHGFTLSAYLGVYFIFWSGGNILITTVINNHYWPKICAPKISSTSDYTIVLASFFAALLISVVTMMTICMGAYFFAPLVWVEYIDIDRFLIISSIALCLRSISAWLGMMVLSYNDLIMKKTKVQLVIVLFMFGFVSLYNFSGSDSLAWMLVILEIGYFLGYLFYSLPVIRENYLSK
jgi:hypothetical protein